MVCGFSCQQCESSLFWVLDRWYWSSQFCFSFDDHMLFLVFWSWWMSYLQNYYKVTDDIYDYQEIDKTVGNCVYLPVGSLNGTRDWK